MVASQWESKIFEVLLHTSQIVSNLLTLPWRKQTSKHDHCKCVARLQSSEYPPGVSLLIIRFSEGRGKAASLSWNLNEQNTPDEHHDYRPGQAGQSGND